MLTLEDWDDMVVKKRCFVTLSMGYSDKYLNSMWAFFRVNDKCALEKYPNVDNIRDQAQYFMDNYSFELFKIVLPYFKKLVDDTADLAMLFFMPNFINQKDYMIIRVKDQFIVSNNSITRKEERSIFNDICLYKNKFGNTVAIGYYDSN